ncbi:MAG TPA: hypothetical protein VIY49_19145 [Bryobacteraceae bacterium]
MIVSASEHVAWEYTALLAAAAQMAEGHGPPINHEVQESFLVHVRNLAEFFHKGVGKFRRDRSVPPVRSRDNIYAVDLVTAVSWNESLFDPGTKLRRAIDKTLSHMTYSRDLRSGQSEIDVAFEARLHAHGTVKLLRRTWFLFWDDLRPDVRASAESWMRTHADGLALSLQTFDADFEARVRRLRTWKLDITPDGPV